MGRIGTFDRHQTRFIDLRSAFRHVPAEYRLTCIVVSAYYNSTMTGAYLSAPAVSGEYKFLLFCLTYSENFPAVFTLRRLPHHASISYHRYTRGDSPVGGDLPSPWAHLTLLQHIVRVALRCLLSGGLPLPDLPCSIAKPAPLVAKGTTGTGAQKVFQGAEQR